MLSHLLVLAIILLLLLGAAGLVVCVVLAATGHVREVLVSLEEELRLERH